MGNVLDAIVHTADIQDQDGAPDLVAFVKNNVLALTKIFGNGGYGGENWPPPSRALTDSLWKLSDAPIPRKSSLCYRKAGSRSVHSPGWADAAGWPRTGKPLSPRRNRGCFLLRRAASYAPLLGPEGGERGYESDSEMTGLTC